MRPRGERGMATVASLGLISVVAGAATLSVLVGGVVAARHRAGAAADFAALAAAQRWQAGPVTACRAAAAVARADGAILESCRLTGAVAEVRVSVPLGGALSRRFPGLGAARVSARAGP